MSRSGARVTRPKSCPGRSGATRSDSGSRMRLYLSWRPSAPRPAALSHSCGDFSVPQPLALPQASRERPVSSPSAVRYCNSTARNTLSRLAEGMFLRPSMFPKACLFASAVREAKQPREKSRAVSAILVLKIHRRNRHEIRSPSLA